jgi:hypothetical protein
MILLIIGKRMASLCKRWQLLALGVLVTAVGPGAQAASVADLTYLNHGTYIEITACTLSATGELVIPEFLDGLPVTIIGASAFEGCAGLTAITLPDSLTTIQSRAFRECNGLGSIHIPDSVTNMGSQAFNRCANLQEVRLSNSVSVINRNTFGYCSSLEKITIPASVTSILGNGFLNCSSLSEILFRGDLPNIGTDAFKGISGSAVIYHTVTSTGLDDSDISGISTINIGHFSPFKEWLIGHGMDHDLDPETDLNGNGLSLFDSFAFNLEPHEINRPLVQKGISSHSLGLSYFSMAPWVAYLPLQSNNLVDWKTDGIVVAGPDADGISSAQVSVEGAPVFMRLKIDFPVLFVSPGGAGSAFQRNQPGNISDALNVAPPGATIRLLPGTYSRIDVNISGEPDNPVTLVSDSTNPDQFAVIDGGNTSGNSGNEGMRISNASWLVIENLKFQNCWQDIINLNNCSYITVRGCDFSEGTTVVYAEAGSHHVLMEHNTWKQREEIWYEWSWADVHHSEVEDLRHYNGSFYDGHGFGAAVIRNNQFAHVFNGIQVWSNSPNMEANIEIYGNRMDYVRDNCIEPERVTFNLHVYHNEFNQTGSYIFSLLHNTTSYDDPAMLLNGPMYVYGNVGYWDPSDPVGGLSTWTPEYAVVKNCKWFTGEPVVFYHNSWKYKRFGLPNTTDNDRQMHHFNNIGSFLDGYSIKTQMQFAEWGNAFDYDFSNQPWQTHLIEKGQEANGIVAPDPGWTDPANGDYRLQPGSVCIDAGTVIPGFTQSYDGAAPDIGAYEGDKLVEGPPFYVMEPPGGLGYVEKPRITRHRVASSQLTLFWSWPLDPATVQNDQIVITADGRDVTVIGHSIAAPYRELVLTLDRDIEGAVLEIDFESLPVGDNGETGTLWASPF